MEKPLSAFVRDLREASKDRAVLVEGKRDRESLIKLGIKNVFTLGGKRFADLPDMLEDFSEVILLFDLDKHGERINRKVRDILSTQGYILIEDFRERMRGLNLLFVEELYEKVRDADSYFGTGQAHKVKLKSP
ncbi:toprim domain-containing protein [Hydrogenobacter thermophilus]|uniref:toprim domain-containing protein n=1 Tax=Hydrogenobacter thermophilus TaxID=940 RepID=UPI0030FAF0D7